MAACPNCGRRTFRTKDWVCQWCGYPLLSGGYKQIDKTYKELQEERNSAWKSVKPEPEPEFDFEEEPEQSSEPQRQQKSLPESENLPEPEDKTEIGSEPAPSPQSAPQPAPLSEPELMTQEQPELLDHNHPEPVPLPEAEAEPELEPAAEQQPMITPPPQTMEPPREEIPAEPAEEQQPIVTPPPPPIEPPRQEIPPASQTMPSLDSIQDNTELTIEQLDALFQADSMKAHTALRDKTIIIRGIVNKLFIRDHIDVRYMILTGTGKVVWSARCSFEKESVGPMSRLNEGQAIALRGKYDGFSKNIIFKECVLVG